MIDWKLTKEKFNRTTIDGYRPKVICKCDICGKEKIITIRVKSKVVDNQMNWECPKCVSSRKEIKEKLKQSTLKSWKDSEYQKKQSEKSLRIWEDPEYRKTISKKNTKYFNQTHIKEELKNKYIKVYNTPEKKKMFRKNSLNLWKNQEFKKRMIQKFNTKEYKEKISKAAKARWKTPEYRKLMAEYQLKMPKVSSIQDVLYSILDDLNINHFREYADKPGDPQTKIGPYCFDCVIPRENQPDLIIECQGDYWHSKKIAIQRDQAKATYINQYFKNQYEMKYLWEHEFLNKNRILDKIKFWFGFKSLPVKDFKFKEISIKSIASKECRKFLTKYHYLTGIGRGGVAYAAFLDDKIIGCCIFSPLLRQNILQNSGYKSKEIKELSRFCIHPQYQKQNFGSWLISKCINQLKLTTSCKLILTYADTTFNHQGIIYKAANFQFDGEVKPSYWYVSKDGWVMHKKTLYNHARSLKMTEKEFAIKKGYKKVWGKKKLRFLYTLNS